MLVCVFVCVCVCVCVSPCMTKSDSDPIQSSAGTHPLMGNLSPSNTRWPSPPANWRIGRRLAFSKTVVECVCMFACVCAFKLRSWEKHLHLHLMPITTLSPPLTPPPPPPPPLCRSTTYCEAASSLSHFHPPSVTSASFLAPPTSSLSSAI